MAKTLGRSIYGETKKPLAGIALGVRLLSFGDVDAARFVFLLVAKYIAARLHGSRSRALGAFRIMTSESLDKAFVGDFVPRLDDGYGFVVGRRLET